MSGNEVAPSSAELARKIFLFCPESVGHKVVLAKRAPSDSAGFTISQVSGKVSQLTH